MRPYLAIILGGMLLAAGTTSAQQFQVRPDSLEGHAYVDSLAVFNARVDNLWDQQNNIRWQNNVDVPQDWVVEICQGTLLCWPPWVTSDTLRLGANASDTLEVKFMSSGSTGTGHATITLTAVADTTIRQVFTFTCHMQSLDVRNEGTPTRGFISLDAGFVGGVGSARFALPQAGAASLELFDLAGRKVNSLWQGMTNGRGVTVSFSSNELPAGFYIVRLDAGPVGSAARKVLLVR